MITEGGGSDRQKLGEKKKRAVGEKQRSSQPVTVKKKEGKQSLKKKREERESICHRRLAQPD